MKKLFLILLLSLVASAYSQSSVKFTAIIKDRLSDTIRFTGPKKFKQLIPVGKDGVFTSSFDVTPGMYQFFDGSEYTMLYLKPGFDLTMNLDTKEWDESIRYSGKGAVENNYLAQKALIEEAFFAKMEGIDDEDTWMAALNKKELELMEALEAEAMDPDFKKITATGIANDTKGAMAEIRNMVATKKLNGSMSPTFNYENYKGGKTKLEDLRGKYVYIDVWATWCGPCIQQIPHLKRVEKKYHDKNIEFVSLSIDPVKDHAKWKKFVADKGLGGIQLFADNEWESEFVKAYMIQGIPRFILIDPDGKIVSADAHRPSNPELEKQLDVLVK
jgi:thiol-disulfide isomerase/thioredoxin